MLIVIDPLSGFYFCFENVFQENYILYKEEREQSTPVLAGCQIITTPSNHAKRTFHFGNSDINFVGAPH